MQEITCDVFVAGGGVAGVMAACAAAKAGSSVVLCETASCLGAVVTQGPLEALMTQYDQNRKVISGLADELMDILKEMDPRCRNVPDTTGYCAKIVPYQAELMKVALGKLLEEYQVTCLLEHTLSQVTREGKKLTSARLQGKYGETTVYAKAYVDCTGSGNLGALAGNEILLGDGEGHCQPVSVLTKWGGVDQSLLRQYVAEHQADFQCFTGDVNLSAEILHLWGFRGALKEGFESGHLSLFRQEIHVMETTVPGEVVVNYSRVNPDLSDPQWTSKAALECSRQVLELLSWFQKTIPAFQNAVLLQSGYLGIRENGRVRGHRVLCKKDLEDGSDDGTSVAMGAFPIDIHRPDSGMQFERLLKGYCIPADTLAARSVENLFMGGRCISSDFEANGSARISITCMATGQAAGVMASIQANQDTWSPAEARKELLRQGAIIN